MWGGAKESPIETKAETNGVNFLYEASRRITLGEHTNTHRETHTHEETLTAKNHIPPHTHTPHSEPLACVSKDNMPYTIYIGT